MTESKLFSGLTEINPKAHHTITTARLHPLICTGAEPIHPVHGRLKLPAAEATPRTEVTFLPDKEHGQAQ